uniref:Pentacotripeptide-repeat region of PRORP domain-containing protein n=1 Tax=Oryza punctata TaxID=4537 RepID=A0A0E0M6Z7_ORYPU
MDAMRLAKEMILHGCSLDVVSYNGLIKAMCKDVNVDRTLCFLKKWQKMERRVHYALELSKQMLNQGLTPDIVIPWQLYVQWMIGTIMQFLPDIVKLYLHTEGDC